MKPPADERALQQQFDALSQVVEAAYSQQETAAVAVAGLERTRWHFERDAAGLPPQLRQAVHEAMSEATAAMLSVLRESHAAADNAVAEARRHETAARSLWWKNVLLLSFAQIALLFGTWMFVRLTIPPADEIQAHRDELAQLQQNLAVLERRGARLQFTTCLDQKERAHRCVRLHDSLGQLEYRYDGGSYRIPAGY